MDAMNLLWELGRQGVKVASGGGKIFYSPADAVSPQLRQQMKQLKPELLNVLASWPRECLDWEHRSGQLRGRLIPLIGKQVSTPHGIGELGLVGQHLAAVVFRDGLSKVLVRVEEIRPV